LRYAGAAKLATTATGIDVTGIASADQLNSKNGKLFLDDNGTHNGVINAPASLYVNTSASEKIVFGYDRDSTTGGTSVMEISSTGIDVTGRAVVDGLTSSASIVGTSDSNSLGGTTFTSSISTVGLSSSAAITSTSNSNSLGGTSFTSAGIDVTGTVVANDLTLGDSNPTLSFNDSDTANLNHYITSASNANLYYAADSAAVATGKHVFTTQNVERQACIYYPKC
jgi:hypothetical protein